MGCQGSRKLRAFDPFRRMRCPADSRRQPPTADSRQVPPTGSGDFGEFACGHRTSAWGSVVLWPYQAYPAVAARVDCSSLPGRSLGAHRPDPSEQREVTVLLSADPRPSRSGREVGTQPTWSSYPGACRGTQGKLGGKLPSGNPGSGRPALNRSAAPRNASAKIWTPSRSESHASRVAV